MIWPLFNNGGRSPYENHNFSLKLKLFDGIILCRLCGARERGILGNQVGFVHSGVQSMTNDRCQNTLTSILSPRIICSTTLNCHLTQPTEWLSGAECHWRIYRRNSLIFSTHNRIRVGAHIDHSPKLTTRWKRDEKFIEVPGLEYHTLRLWPNSPICKAVERSESLVIQWWLVAAYSINAPPQIRPQPECTFLVGRSEHKIAHFVSRQ